MKKIKLLSRIVSMMLSVSVFVSAVAGYGTRTVYADTRREGDIVYLDSEITGVSDDTVNEWAMEAGLTDCRKELALVEASEGSLPHLLAARRMIDTLLDQEEA